MVLKHKLPDFKVLTSRSVLDISYENEEQHLDELELIIDEQDKILKENNINILKCYKIHFFDGAYTYERIVKAEVDDAIQHLAIKDGYDLVQFENGNIGFVAYYSGYPNGFEIIKKEGKANEK